MKKMTKTKLNWLVKQSKSFIRTSTKGGKEKKDAKINTNRRSSDMHHLRCVNLWRNLHAKGCDTSAGFDIKRLPESVCEGGGNSDW